MLVILIGRAIREEGSGSALIDKMLGRSMALSLKETD
jgi:hypothetical protein